jgi:hypothetical protein
MIRADPDAATELVDTTPAEYAEMRGRPTRGWLRLDAASVRSATDLVAWIEHAVTYRRFHPRPDPSERTCEPLPSENGLL